MHGPPEWAGAEQGRDARDITDAPATSPTFDQGNCSDNAVAESFLATLEHELLTEAEFQTRAAARQALFEFVDLWYNRQRVIRVDRFSATLGFRRLGP